MFEGVFDADAYIALNPDALGGAWAHYRNHGFSQGRMVALKEAETLSLFMDTFEEMTAEASIDDSALSPPEVLSSDEEDDGDDNSDDDDDSDDD